MGALEIQEREVTDRCGPGGDSRDQAVRTQVEAFASVSLCSEPGGRW